MDANLDSSFETNMRQYNSLEVLERSNAEVESLAKIAILQSSNAEPLTLPLVSRCLANMLSTKLYTETTVSKTSSATKDTLSSAHLQHFETCIFINYLCA